MDSLAVFGTTCLLYLFSLTNLHTGDSLWYALQVESGSPLYLLDPFHFLLHPLGWGFWRLWQIFGWQGGSLLPMQVLNALGGATSAALIYHTTRELTNSWKIALLITVGFATSGGIWFLSTDAEFVTIPLALNLLVLRKLVVLPDHDLAKPASAIHLGAGTGLAMLSYLSSLLLMPTVFLRYCLDEKIGSDVRRKQLLRYTGLVVLTGIMLWLVAFIILRRLGGAAYDQQLSDTLFFYAQVTPNDVLHSVYAFLRSLALFPGLGANSSTAEFLAQASWLEQGLWAGYYLAVLSIAVLPIILAYTHRKALWAGNHAVLLTIGTWAGLHMLFAILWVPGDFSFLLPALSAWWLFAGMLIAARNQAIRTAGSGEERRLILPGLLVLLLAVCNACLVILPARDLTNNPDHALLRMLDENTTPADLLVASLDDITGVYLRYFSDRMVYLLPGDPNLDSSQLADNFSQWVQAVAEQGGNIYLVGIDPAQNSILQTASAAFDISIQSAQPLVGYPVWTITP